MSEHKDSLPDEELVLLADDCALCGKVAVRMTTDSIEQRRGKDSREPVVCNKCLVDLRGDMAAELEVRRQLGNLEARVTAVEGGLENANTRTFVTTLFLDGALFLLGVLAGVVGTLAIGG